MTGLPTEPGSVICWGSPCSGVAILDEDGMWAESGEGTLVPPDDFDDTAWWYMGRVTADGITTTR